MARFNELLVGRYNRLAQKLLSMKGPASLVTLSDEMFFQVPMFHGVENRYLESWNLFGTAQGVAAAAANAGAVRLRNPAGSNVLAVIEKANANGPAPPGAADQPFISYGSQTADLASSAVGPAARDSRINQTPSLILSFTNTVVNPSFGATLARGAFAANGVYDFIQDVNQEIPVLPGFAIQIQATVVNQVIGVGFFWRERFLEDSERQ